MASNRPVSGVKQRSLSASASAPTLPLSAPPRAQTPDTRGSRPGSGPARPRTSGSSSTFAQRNRGLGTRSTFGRQVLGGRTSEPSFSFGSAPARVALPAGTQRKGAELQPSVAVSSQKNPGPIYNPKGHKPMGGGPRHVFGTETQRPPAKTNGEVSKITGQSMSPGPGTYALQGAFGPQYLGRCRNLPHYSFGFEKQHKASHRNTSDPGPVYDVPQSATRCGNVVRPTYSFGTGPQRGQPLRSQRVPGPGHYPVPNALGPQLSSVNKSGQVVSFGVPSALGGVGRPIAMTEGQHSPGPAKYSHDSSHGKQNLSGRRTQPVMKFPRGKRFTTKDMAGDDTPGPGHYVV